MTRQEIGKLILNWEARRDSQGRLAVYKLPANDGGGTFEVAGINDKYHPEAANKLRGLINSGHHAEAENYAAEYLAKYTDSTGRLAGNWQTELFLRDCAFNRGPTGAVKILQMALGVTADGKAGPVTIAALRKAEKNTPDFILKLRLAREKYEIKVAGRRENLWRGLVNRWNKVTTAALT